MIELILIVLKCQNPDDRASSCDDSYISKFRIDPNYRSTRYVQYLSRLSPIKKHFLVKHQFPPGIKQLNISEFVSNEHFIGYG